MKFPLSFLSCTIYAYIIYAIDWSYTCKVHCQIKLYIDIVDYYADGDN